MPILRQGGREQGTTIKTNWGQGRTWSEPAKPKMAEDLTPSRPWASGAHGTTAATKWHSRRLQDRAEAGQKRPQSGQGLTSWTPPSLPHNSWNNPPTCWHMKLLSPLKTSHPEALAFWAGPRWAYGTCASEAALTLLEDPMLWGCRSCPHPV